jgi:hypothetical protein
MPNTHTFSRSLAKLKRICLSPCERHAINRVCAERVNRSHQIFWVKTAGLCAYSLLFLIAVLGTGCAARPYPASEALQAKFGKPQRLSRAEQERAAGLNEGRAEVLRQLWEQNAIEGKSNAGATNGTSQPFFRRVWVPERVVNGVTFRAGYQTVLYYR